MDPNQDERVLNQQMLETARDNLKGGLEKEFTGKGVKEEEKEEKKTLLGEFEAQPQRSPPKMRMKKGMRIHFYGYSYKVTAVRPNGKITLRFDGHWKERD